MAGEGHVNGFKKGFTTEAQRKSFVFREMPKNKTIVSEKLYLKSIIE
jgi:hypothetical protein